MQRKSATTRGEMILHRITFTHGTLICCGTHTTAEVTDVRTVCSGLDSDSKLIPRAVVATGVKQTARKDNTASADGGCKAAECDVRRGSRVQKQRKRTYDGRYDVIMSHITDSEKKIQILICALFVP